MSQEVAAGEQRALVLPGRPGEQRQAQFDAIFLEHYPRVVGLIARVVNDRSHADQLASDVFWKLHRRMPGVVSGNVGGWLCRTALRVALDALKAASRRARHETSAAVERGRSAAPADPLASLLAQQRRGRVRTVLAGMKQREARLLLLRSAGFTYRDIAATLALNAGSIGTLLARAERAFERRYHELYGSED